MIRQLYRMDFSFLVDQLQTSIDQTDAKNSVQTLMNTNQTLKICIVSTHIHQTTGYAKVTYGLLKEFAKLPWLSITHYAIQAPIKSTVKRDYPSNVSVINVMDFDKDPVNGGFGFKELSKTLTDLQPNIVFFYNDLAIIAEYIFHIRKSMTSRPFQIWAYIDQVYPGISSSLIDILNRDIDRVFCFTKEWKELLKGQMVTRPIDVMTHGFDSELYKPIPKAIARKSAKLPENAFLFFSLNRNQPRKHLDILIMAFVDLIVKYPTMPIFLMCIADKGESGGYSIFDIFSRELQLRKAPVDQFGRRLLITSNAMCYSDEEINIFYNVADCGVSCSDGEGFGLCPFEQMGLGIPQVVSNIVGHREFCNSTNSLIVNPTIRAYIPNGFSAMGGEVNIVDYRDISKAMETYLLDESLRKVHGAAAQKTVLDYTWEKATKLCIRRLKSMYDDILEGIEDN